MRKITNFDQILPKVRPYNNPYGNAKQDESLN